VEYPLPVYFNPDLDNLVKGWDAVTKPSFLPSLAGAVWLPPRLLAQPKNIQTGKNFRIPIRFARLV
jgi:hypothetical protein